MKTLAFLAIFVSLVGCSFKNIGQEDAFIAAPSSIDDRIGTASIEDYIVALPPFNYHESSVEDFVNQVTRARTDSRENRDKGSNYLFVSGDGTWPSKDFILDRDRRTLKIRVYQWEEGVEDYTESLTRVPGGWIRTPRIQKK
jgi:hypothetical protein